MYICEIIKINPMSQQNLVDIFVDTQEQVNSGAIVSNATTLKHQLTDLGAPIYRKHKTAVSVQNLDTVSAAQILATTGKTAVLNMASPKRPGGGVRNGARAQEECLFRCSDLFKTVTEQYYPLEDTEGLYTTGSVFFKDKDYNTMKPFLVDVVTVAAVNLNGTTVPIATYNELTTAKIRLIFQLANEKGVDNLVLGAWGCGVFKNNPRQVADMFMAALKDYMGCFKEVVFAVINDHNSVGDNHDIFKEVVEYRMKALSRI